MGCIEEARDPVLPCPGMLVCEVPSVGWPAMDPTEGTQRQVHSETCPAADMKVT